MVPAISPEALAAYDFRTVHPRLRFGTASDRYAGWTDQIYPPGLPVKSRSRTLGGERYTERTVPVESVAYYFDHFSVLELDFTFYRPLLDADGAPTSNYFVLSRYAEHAPDRARFLVKAPQAYSAPQVRDGGTFVRNSQYLAVDAYRRRFLDPARELLGDRLAGVLFEQEYRRTGSSPPAEAFVAELDGFFAADGAVPTHLEIRSPHLQTPHFFDWLRSRGLGYVFSHWTWLGPLREQWARTSGRFALAGGESVVRLLTPLKMKYADAYALAYPFDKAVPALSDTAGAQRMIADTARLALKAIEAGAVLNVIANNRAWGNAPELAKAVVVAIVDLLPGGGASEAS